MFFFFFFCPKIGLYSKFASMFCTVSASKPFLGKTMDKHGDLQSLATWTLLPDTISSQALPSFPAIYVFLCIFQTRVNTN